MSVLENLNFAFILIAHSPSTKRNRPSVVTLLLSHLLVLNKQSQINAEVVLV